MNASEASEITRITYRWDDFVGCKAGWYVEAWQDDCLIMDSEKIRFPVDVDDFAEDQHWELETALKRAFPNAAMGQPDRSEALRGLIERADRALTRRRGDGSCAS